MRFPELLSLAPLINILAKINHKGVLTVFGTSEAPCVRTKIFHPIQPVYKYFHPLVHLCVVAERSGARIDGSTAKFKTPQGKSTEEKIFS